MVTNKARQKKDIDKEPDTHDTKQHEANARERMVCLSREQPIDEKALSSRQTPPPKPGEGFLKLARTSRG